MPGHAWAWLSHCVRHATEDREGEGTQFTGQHGGGAFGTLQSAGQEASIIAFFPVPENGQLIMSRNSRWDGKLYKALTFSISHYGQIATAAFRSAPFRIYFEHTSCVDIMFQECMVM